MHRASVLGFAIGVVLLHAHPTSACFCVTIPPFEQVARDAAVVVVGHVAAVHAPPVGVLHDDVSMVDTRADSPRSRHAYISKQYG